MIIRISNPYPQIFSGNMTFKAMKAKLAGKISDEICFDGAMKGCNLSCIIGKKVEKNKKTYSPYISVMIRRN
jgi:hypothetical protein